VTDDELTPEQVEALEKRRTRSRMKSPESKGYTGAELGRMAAERSAINRGTMETHAFVLDWTVSVRQRNKVCARCGQPPEAPIHEHATAPETRGPPVKLHRDRNIKRYGDEL
jgi:predicted secreted Zn-dependent protease